MNKLKFGFLIVILTTIIFSIPIQTLADTSGSGYKTSGSNGSYILNYDDDDACNNEQVKTAVKIVGKIISIIQIVAPIILVIMALVDITKAIIAGDDAKSKKSTSALIKRLITAVIIFFVIAIVRLVCQLVGDNSMDSCLNLISNPW